MADIDDVLRAVSDEVSPTFEARLRARLSGESREALIEHVVKLALAAHGMTPAPSTRSAAAPASAPAPAPAEVGAPKASAPKPAAVAAPAPAAAPAAPAGHGPLFGGNGDQVDALGAARARADRLDRVRALSLDRKRLEAFLEAHGRSSREALAAAGYVMPAAPRRGAGLLGPTHRTAAGEALLTLAKDILEALLVGDSARGAGLEPASEVRVSVSVPPAKASALAFLVDDAAAAGAASVREDAAGSVVVEVRFGEVADGELVSRGVLGALGLVNALELNEHLLDASVKPA